jgi:hypothetical protein
MITAQVPSEKVKVKADSGGKKYKILTEENSFFYNSREMMFSILHF